MVCKWRLFFFWRFRWFANDHGLTVNELALVSSKCNLGSLEIRVSTYISAKLKKRTYMYDSLQFPVEMNTRGSKTDNFYSFSHEV